MRRARSLRILFLLGSAACVHGIHAQELVINGGLEAFGSCPEGPVMKRWKVDGQVRAAQGNPDHYAACSSTFGEPANWSGSQHAWEGSAYAGLVLTSDMPDECGSREYLQFSLARPLENGRRYRLTFHISTAENSGYITDRVGALFSAQDLSPNKVRGGLRERPDIENRLGRFLSDTSGWMTVTGVYNALGGERYVLIGNFHPCNNSSRKRRDPDKKRSAMRKTAARLDPDPRRGGWQEWMGRTAYVYLDGVSLVPDTTSPEQLTTLTAGQACAVPAGASPGPELIPDPAFDHNEHPKPNSWRNASDGTPDLLNGLTGLYLFSAGYRDNREYIRTPLADTLSPCATYRIAFDVRRNPSYAYAVDAIGIAVTDTFSTRRDRLRMDLPWAWRSPPGALITRTDQPITVCGSFSPSTCATQLLLGNFGPDSTTTLWRMGNETDGPFAYYFVDNVHLHETARTPGCVDSCRIPPIAMVAAVDSASPWPDRLTLLFDTDSDQPLGMDEAALQRLVDALHAGTILHVHITGHTDDSGSAGRNRRLAQARADRLRMALLQRGAPPDRITTSSAGSSDPIADNATPDGRALNRRVEVEVRH